MIVTRGYMIEFVEDQIKKGLSRVDAIRNLAFALDEDDPCDSCVTKIQDEWCVEVWFQQKIAGE